MKTHNRNLGVIGLAVALATMVTVVGCDPYNQATKDAPFVTGVIMPDVFGGGVEPDTAGCALPYPQISTTWADQAYPGLCGQSISMCPVTCFPPRTGPGFAPFFLGTLGGQYQTTSGSMYTYQSSAAYVLNEVPVPPVEVDYQYSWIKIVFNKLMTPASIEVRPFSGIPPSTLWIEKNGVNDTANFTFQYNPNSEASYWGGAIDIFQADGNPLDCGTSYHVRGTVSDQDGNPLTVDVTVNTTACLTTGAAATR